MRKILFLFAALSLVGCAEFNALSKLSTPIQNPVGVDQQYAVEAAAYAIRRVGVQIIRQRQCRKSELASPASNLCVPRAYKAQVQAVDQRLITALNVVRTFSGNETFTLADAISQVWSVVAEYKSIVGAK